MYNVNFEWGDPFSNYPYFLGGIFYPKSKINSHRIHDNQDTNFYNGLKWPYSWVILETELKLYIVHILKGLFLA